MKYIASPDQMIYGEDRAKAGPLKAPAANCFGSYHGATPPCFIAIANVPKCWNRFLGSMGLPPSSDLPVFLHERSSPQARHRLIFVTVARFDDTLSWEFGAYIYRQQDGLIFCCAPQNIRKTKIRSLSFFAGQPDPADESHFSIAYKADGQNGTIDGWLQDGDKIKVQVRDGPAKPP